MSVCFVSQECWNECLFCFTGLLECVSVLFHRNVRMSVRFANYVIIGPAIRKESTEVRLVLVLNLLISKSCFIIF